MTYVDKLIKITVVNKNEIEKLENIKHELLMKSV